MVYEQIKSRAEKQGITIAEVARRADIDPTLIGKWKRSSPSLENAKRVADVLGCTVDDLIRDDGAADESAMLPAS